ncbi:MAG: hypothetical protein ABW026_14325 [Microvirga sp.]
MPSKIASVTGVPACAARGIGPGIVQQYLVRPDIDPQRRTGTHGSSERGSARIVGILTLQVRLGEPSI